MPRRISSFIGVILISGPLFAGTFKIDNRTFMIPDGFTIEKIAGPPLVDRPITGDFDEQGNFYVSDSSGSSAPTKQQLAEKPHRIVKLTDTDGDGKFDKQTVFADKMRSDAWYLSIAPLDNPIMAMAVLLEGPGPGISFYGGKNAAPIAAQLILKANSLGYFNANANASHPVQQSTNPSDRRQR